jgi:hypothetical protein
MAPLLEPPPPRPDNDTEEEISPEERQALVDQMDRVRQQKLEALHAPGLSWREWFYFDALKWWIGLGCFIVDVWIVSWWVEGAPWYLGVVTLAAGIYLEILLFRYLWYRPREETSRQRGAFRRTVWHPVEFGRWTPEWRLVQQGRLIPGADEGPSPKEFV